MLVELPQIEEEDLKYTSFQAGKPGWIRVVEYNSDRPCKPVIRCNCGKFVGLALHHVHADGTVTASFYHKRGKNYKIGESEDGCEWHVYLKLLDYHDGEFLPKAILVPS